MIFHISDQQTSPSPPQQSVASIQPPQLTPMPPHLMQSNSRLSMGSPPPPTPHPSSQGPSPDINIDQMHLMARQNNLFHFGDVTVSNHPDTQPVPMVVPMVYLCPLPVKQTKGKTQPSLGAVLISTIDEVTITWI